MKSKALTRFPSGLTASQRTLRKGLSFFGGTCVVATLGYVAAGWDWLDAIYMVTITIFSVGYGEVNPIHEPWLKCFTIAVIFAGCSSLIFVVGGIVQMITEGEVARIMGTRSRTKEIDQLHDHTIICGYGRVGQMLALELAEHGHQSVILDRDPCRVERACEDGHLAMQGDAADDETLSKVGIFRAKTLATVLPDDATNVFITLSARDLCETINIVARAEYPSTERKLLRGGATSVVMPASIGAVRIAQLATQSSDANAVLPQDRFRMLEPGCNRQATAEVVQSEEEVAHEVEKLAELAAETVHAEDEHILDEIKKANC